MTNFKVGDKVKYVAGTGMGLDGQPGTIVSAGGTRFEVLMDNPSLRFGGIGPWISIAEGLESLITFTRESLLESYSIE